MRFNKIFLIAIFILSINFNLFPNNFKIISRQGETSIIVNEENSNMDFKKVFQMIIFLFQLKNLLI